MAQRFLDLRNKVRDWSNRDTEALPDTIIEDTMNWAADKAYRILRVPPLEFITNYNDNAITTENGTNLYTALSRIRIPDNLIEFIQIRSVDENDQTVRVFNEKADIRTFRDLYAEKYNDYAFWTREGNDLLLAPALGTTGGTFGSTGVGNEVRFELYYYGRLDRLDARQNVTRFNLWNGLLTDPNPTASGRRNDDPIVIPQVTVTYAVRSETNENGEPILVLTPNYDMPTDPMFSMISTRTTVNNIMFRDTGGMAVTLPMGTVRTPTGNTIIVSGFTSQSQLDMLNIASADELIPASTETYYGIEIDNWLRDENERIIIYGALAEIFTYLQEDDQVQKYTALFQREIAELNDEDVKRNASGGNVQVNFNGRGLI